MEFDNKDSKVPKSGLKVRLLFPSCFLIKEVLKQHRIMPLKIYAKLSHHFSQREPWPPILCERFWLPAEEVVISHVSEFVCDRQQLIAESYERASIKSGGLITPDPTRDWWFRSGISAVKWLLIFFAVTTVQPAETEDCLQIYTLFMWKSKVWINRNSVSGRKSKAGGYEAPFKIHRFLSQHYNCLWLTCVLSIRSTRALWHTTGWKSCPQPSRT